MEFAPVTHKGFVISGPPSVELFHDIASALGDDTLAYFFGDGVGPIKIGWTNNPKRRLRQLRSGTKRDLRILATRPGGRRREFAYHYQFRDHAIGGEWFERHPDILAEIARLSPAQGHVERLSFEDK